jgi:hypothetical protein
VVVPKLNKNGYSSPGSFRPIHWQLLERLGKVLDKIIARRIQYQVAKTRGAALTDYSHGSEDVYTLPLDAGLAFTVTTSES